MFCSTPQFHIRVRWKAEELKMTFVHSFDKKHEHTWAVIFIYWIKQGGLGVKEHFKMINRNNMGEINALIIINVKVDIILKQESMSQQTLCVSLNSCNFWAWQIFHAGQAFRLGRYPIHWHLLGDLQFKSYVKGCAIHQTYNRAITIHNTHHLLVERNIIYDIRGGAFFIEDGIEHGNILQYNLAVFH